MIEIIESGKTKFIAVCSKCGCKFSYELCDLDVVFKKTVNCPECNDTYYHPNQSEICVTATTAIINNANSDDKLCDSAYSEEYLCLG